MERNTKAISEFLKHVPEGKNPGDMFVVPGWGPAEWSSLLSRAQPVELAPGEVLIQVDDEDDRILYFVTSGRLEVATIDKPGGVIGSIATIQAGSVVGELAFFEGAPRSAKVWAVTSAQLLKFTFRDYEIYARDNVHEANAFLFAMARLLSFRLRNFATRL